MGNVGGERVLGNRLMGTVSREACTTNSGWKEVSLVGIGSVVVGHIM